MYMHDRFFDCHRAEIAAAVADECLPGACAAHNFDEMLAVPFRHCERTLCA
jgi:hypothetical protein